MTARKIRVDTSEDRVFDELAPKRRTRKQTKKERTGHLAIVSTAGAWVDSTLDDDLRTRELILFVRCLFGKPGLQIADYAGTLSSTVIQTTKRGAQKHGAAGVVQAA
jgi:hypothetical protein